MSFSVIDLMDFFGSVSFGFLGPDMLGLMICVIFCAMITRDKGKILLLLAPMSLFVENFGFETSALVKVLFAIIFVVTIYSEEGFNEFISTTDSQ